MPPSDNTAVRDLANAATIRIDLVEDHVEKIEGRVREIERRNDRLDGAGSLWPRLQPWISSLIALAALAFARGWI